MVQWQSSPAVGDGAMRLAADRVAVVEEAEPVEQSHHPLVAVEARRGEADRPPEVPHEMPVRLVHVRRQVLVGQLVEPAAPDDVIHAAVQPQLVAFGLQLLELGHEAEPHRPGERRLQEEAGPAGLLDEVDRFPVGELGLRAADALAEPLAEVGGAAEVDEEGVGHAEIAAHRADPRQPVGDAYPMIDVPAKREQPIAHRRAPAPMPA